MFRDRQAISKVGKIEKLDDNRGRAISVGKIAKIAVAASALWTDFHARDDHYFCRFFGGCYIFLENWVELRNFECLNRAMDEFSRGVFTGGTTSFFGGAERRCLL